MKMAIACMKNITYSRLNAILYEDKFMEIRERNLKWKDEPKRPENNIVRVAKHIHKCTWDLRWVTLCKSIEKR